MVNLEHDTPFSCSERKDVYGKTLDIECVFDKSPSNKFTRSETLFFKISSDVQSGKFIVKLEPKKSALIVPLPYSLRDGDAITISKPMFAKKWEIIGYEGKLPFVEPQKPKGINFPISINSQNLPTIGALDISKKPLTYEEGRDVPVYLSIKKQIENEEYERALFTTNDAIKDFPNSIFTKEFLFFKAKALYYMPNSEAYEDVIEIAKAWIKKYPSDEMVSEALLLLGNAYHKLGLTNESNYYFDRIFSEHQGEKQEKLAKIAYGDILAQKGTNQKAMEQYEQALSETDDIAVASLAAYKLGQKLLELKNYKNAAPEFQKIYNANKEFYGKNLKETIDLSAILNESGAHKLASDLAFFAMNKVDKNEDVYEQLYVDGSYRLELSGDKKGAYEKYKAYSEMFKNGGKNEDFIKERLDRLFFEMGDMNQTKKIEELDRLAEAYPKTDVADKAYAEKAQIFFDSGDYKRVIALKTELRKIINDENSTKKTVASELLRNSAAKIATSALAGDNCTEALSYVLDYNLTLPSEDDRKLFECSLRSRQHDIAENIAMKYQNSKNQNERLEWLYKLGKLYFAQKEYQKTIAISSDIYDLSKSIEEKRYRDILIERYLAQEALNAPFDELLTTAKLIEKLLPKESRAIDIYRNIVDKAQKDKNDLITAEYAKKTIELKTRLNVKTYTPAIEITYAEAMIKLNEFAKAREMLESLDKKSMDGTSKAKVLYSIAFTYQKESNDQKAKEAFTECSEVNSTTPWVGVCKDALKLIQ